MTHEGQIKRLKSEKETLSKSLTSVKSNLESVKSQRGELETTVQNMELSEMGRLHSERQQELDQLKMTHSILTREKAKSDEKVFQLELKLSDLTENYAQLESAHNSTLGRQEKLYNPAIMENKMFEMECGTLSESLDHLKGNDPQQLTQMSTFPQSISVAKLALRFERAKTVREHKKCKRWQTEYNTIQTTCDTIHGDIVNLLGKLSNAEMELESPNQRIEDMKKGYISKLEGFLEIISEEKGVSKKCHIT